MADVFDFVGRVAASEVTTVLLEGETGTGKEVVAHLRMRTCHWRETNAG